MLFLGFKRESHRDVQYKSQLNLPKLKVRKRGELRKMIEGRMGSMTG